MAYTNFNAGQECQANILSGKSLSGNHDVTAIQIQTHDLMENYIVALYKIRSQFCMYSSGSYLPIKQGLFFKHSLQFIKNKEAPCTFVKSVFDAQCFNNFINLQRCNFISFLNNTKSIDW